MLLKWTVTARESVSQSVSGVESLHSALVKQEISQKGQDFPPSRRTFTPACNYAYGFTSNFIVRDFKRHVDGIIVGFVSFRRLTFFRAILALVMWYVCKSFFCTFERAVFINFDSSYLRRKKEFKNRPFWSNRSQMEINRLSVNKRRVYGLDTNVTLLKKQQNPEHNRTCYMVIMPIGLV